MVSQIRIRRKRNEQNKAKVGEVLQSQRSVDRSKERTGRSDEGSHQLGHRPGPILDPKLPAGIATDMCRTTLDFAAHSPSSDPSIHRMCLMSPRPPQQSYSPYLIAWMLPTAKTDSSIQTAPGCMVRVFASDKRPQGCRLLLFPLSENQQTGRLPLPRQNIQQRARHLFPLG
jgi:hypothetical protein